MRIINFGFRRSVLDGFFRGATLELVRVIRFPHLLLYLCLGAL
jgi:hypothetical protein